MCMWVVFEALEERVGVWGWPGACVGGVCVCVCVGVCVCVCAL